MTIISDTQCALYNKVSVMQKVTNIYKNNINNIIIYYVKYQ